MNHSILIGLARIALPALLLVLSATADWTYEYFDDFSTDKAQHEAYSYAMFWTLDANPLPEPHLKYVETGAGQGLLFTEYKGRSADLVYRFPIAEQTHRTVMGVVEVEVSTIDFPCTVGSPQIPRGELAYSVSADGHSWSPPQFLSAGPHRISVGSPEGRCYVRFSGDRAVIDRIRVSLSSPRATIRVPAQFHTIQQAIDAAGDGAIIEVAPNTYTGPGNWDIDFRGKRITVRSTEGPHNTIIDCGSPPASAGRGRRGFHFRSGETRESVLAGFTIRGGRAYGTTVPTDVSRWNPNPAHPIGGGIYCEFSSPTILNCIIEDCSAEVGGGIGSVGGRPAILHSTIRDCTARSRGAGIALIGQSDAWIAHTTIQDNIGHQDSLGAGLYVLQSAAEVVGCVISGNFAPGAQGRGGGVYGGGSSTDITLRNCVISQNQANTGAGVLIERAANGTSPSISAGLSCSVALINCTIAQNQLSSGFGAGGVYANGAYLTIRNSIVWHNDGMPLTITGPAGGSSVTYSNIEWGYLGKGNIADDPLFASLTMPDYHLQSVAGRYDPQIDTWLHDWDRSPCIDAGDPDDSPADEPGRNGGRINMGAYGGTARASMSGRILQVPMDGYPTIQDGIDAAYDGDAVLVGPGVYHEDISFKGKAITVQSAGHPAVITAPDGYGATFKNAEDSRSILANFVVTGSGKGAIFCDGAWPTLKNLTIARNGAGIVLYGGASPYIANCIIWDNAGASLSAYTANFNWRMYYSCHDQISPNKQAGNINTDPLFANSENRDFHLKSSYGRYAPQTGTWVYDAVSSPGIDAGDPAEFPGNEPIPHGNRINIGAYGGTPYASKSAGPVCP
jgi:hypothetical protein